MSGPTTVGGQSAALLLPTGYLSTEGNRIVDSGGNPVRIASIGWGGTDSLTFAPYGLWQSSLQSNINAIKAAGFNTIRIPWTDLLLSASPKFSSSYAAFNPSLDPELVGKTSLQVLDILVADAGAAGLKVIFDHHDDDGGPGGWGGQQANGLWFDSGPGSNGTDGSGTTGTVTAAKFLSNSVELAQHFAGNSTVIGFDLDNEPTSQGNINWGQGGPTDIQAMYTQVGNAIQAVDPGALIICEGVQNWSGPKPGMPAGFAEGDLSGVAIDPVTLNISNKVVYSVHEYPPDLSGNGSYTSSQQIAEMNAGWGYLETGDIAPVWVGEIGSNMDSLQDQTWIQGVLDYMNGKDAAEGGPSFSGAEQPVSGSWWQWGTASGQDPQGIETAWGSETYWSSQITATNQLLFTNAGSSSATSAPSITSSGGLTNVAVHTVTGTAEAGSTVKIYDNVSATALATAVANSSGTWSTSLTLPTQGANSLAATATDAAGNVSLTSAPQLLTLDTIAPSAPLIISSGGLTNVAVHTVTGTAEAGSTVKIYDNISATALATAVTSSSGIWSTSLTLPTQGANSLTATATDAARNVSLTSAPQLLTLDTIAPQPTIKIITGNRDGGVTLAGVSEANSTVTVAETVGKKTTSLGSVTASGAATWQLTSHALVNTSTLNSFSVTAQDSAGNTGSMAGMLYLSSTGADTLTGTPGVSDVFAIMSFRGSDVINNFQAALVAGSVHDYVDFSGRGITSFSQVQSMLSGTSSTVIAIGGGKLITLTDVAPTTLTASDFRYS